MYKTSIQYVSFSGKWKLDSGKNTRTYDAAKVCVHN